MVVARSSGASCESPPHHVVSGKDIVFQIDGSIEALDIIKLHAQRLGAGVPFDVDDVVLAVFYVQAGSTGFQRSCEAIWAVVVVGSIALEGNVVISGVTEVAVVPSVELNDDAGVECGVGKGA